MKATVYPPNSDSYESDVHCMEDIRKIVEGEHEIVKIDLTAEKVLIANANSSLEESEKNIHFKGFKGVLVTLSDSLIFEGSFYD